MKKGVVSDLIMWIVALLVGVLVRPYLSPQLEGIFAAFSIPNIVSGLIVGIIWVLLRFLIRIFIRPKAPRWVIIIITILIVPFALQGLWLLGALGPQTSRIVLMFPLFIAGFAWGIYSEVRSA